MLFVWSCFTSGLFLPAAGSCEITVCPPLQPVVVCSERNYSPWCTASWNTEEGLAALKQPCPLSPFSAWWKQKTLPEISAVETCKFMMTYQNFFLVSAMALFLEQHGLLVNCFNSRSQIQVQWSGILTFMSQVINWVWTVIYVSCTTKCAYITRIKLFASKNLDFFLVCSGTRNYCWLKLDFSYNQATLPRYVLET